MKPYKYLLEGAVIAVVLFFIPYLLQNYQHSQIFWTIAAVCTMTAIVTLSIRMLATVKRISSNTAL